MNSTNNNPTAIVDNIIQEYQENNIFNWLLFSSTILPFYVALLKLSQEIEHIWLKSFSLPTWLYIFARYGALALGVLNLAVNLVPLGRSCNMLANVTSFASVLTYIGVQGLMVVRAHTLCRGKIPATVALAFGFLSRLVLHLYSVSAFPGCFTSLPTSDVILGSIDNICNILTDILIFGICMWKVWGTWKLKREAGIQSTHSLVSVLMAQSILKFCFVIVISVTTEVLTEFQNSTFLFQILSYGFTLYQNALSSILVADFTLDLRSLNSTKIEANNKSLPPMQLSNVLQRVHQSLIIELATPDPENINVEGDHDNPGFESMEDSDIQTAQD